MVPLPKRSPRRLTLTAPALSSRCAVVVRASNIIIERAVDDRSAPSVLDCSGVFGLSLEGSEITLRGLALQRSRSTRLEVNTIALRVMATEVRVMDCTFYGFGDAAIGAGCVDARGGADAGSGLQTSRRGRLRTSCGCVR